MMTRPSENDSRDLTPQQLIDIFRHMDTILMEKEKLLYPASLLIVSAAFAAWDKIESKILLSCL